MMQVGVDLEQFVRDPYGSGIQRVLQQLALTWPTDEVPVDFVAPMDNEFALLDAQQAAELCTLPFQSSDQDLRERIDQHLRETTAPRVRLGELLAMQDAWLLPEVSYLPSVLERLRIFSASMPTTMIGYDTLPMTEPANYRFPPGQSPWVSEYFQFLARVDSVVCISSFARDSIVQRLRRDPFLPISVAHPGGDHVPIETSLATDRVTFVRLGTLEARKMPVEILRGFLSARERVSTPMELVFIGGPSPSDDAINQHIENACTADMGVRWVQGASDQEVNQLLRQASVFLAMGVEGYGIPVLEALRSGTPVLFDGIQPAAELMAGKGALRVHAMDAASMSDVFTTFAHHSAIDELKAHVDPASVPTWREFTHGVINAIRAAFP